MNRVPGLTQELGALLLVAVVADFRLGLEGHDRVIGCMNVVAIHAGIAFHVVRAARPMEAPAIVVAGHAHFVLFLHRFLVTEGHGGRQTAAVFLFPDVMRAGPVTGFAIVVAFGKW